MSRDFSVIGHALSAPVRSAFVNMLMDGSNRPASELAARARVSRSTASEHLTVLMDAGLVRCSPKGRQRFYRLADASVAGALELLGHLSPPAPAVGYNQTREARELAQARFCYDHLAGRLGVALTTAMVRNGWLEQDNLALTQHGAAQFSALGIGVPMEGRGKRPYCRPCADWTERTSHLAGALGALIAARFLEQSWVTRREGSRGLNITSEGYDALHHRWHVSPAELSLTDH